MTGKTETASQDAVSDVAQGRQRSSISFPYMDLKSAIALAEAIHRNVGGRGDCDDNQLAVWSGQSPKSSTFRVQFYAARIFGVIDGDGGRHKLTDLGRLIVDPTREREGRVQAFLNVPLYKALYENNAGGVLPPAAALEREMVALGVSEKQKDRARQVFERSAEQAGFFEHGKNRLVKPGISGGDAPRDEKPPEEAKDRSGSGGRGGGSNDGLDLDPLLMAVLRLIPPSSEEWPAAKRLRWFKAFAMNVSQVYDHDEPVELDIKLEKEPSKGALD